MAVRLRRAAVAPLGVTPLAGPCLRPRVIRRRAIRLAAKLGHFQDVLKRAGELREKDAEMLAAFRILGLAGFRAEEPEALASAEAGLDRDIRASL